MKNAGNQIFLITGILGKKDKKRTMKTHRSFKVTDGFEPTIRELQSHALPLG